MATQPKINPYQAPQVNLANDYADNQDSYWRDGKILVLKREGQLPPRCIKCNADAQMPMRRKSLSWHHPGWYCLLLLNLIIYAIVATLARKRAKIEFGLCEEHAAKRRKVIIASWAIFLASAGTAFLLGQKMEDPGIPAAIAIAGLLIALIVAIVGARTVYAKRIDDREIRLAGCGEPFLDGATRSMKL
ncbi:MAG TPA: hypothetical protein VF472_14445 [Burkholderiaceae bacterium]